MAHPIPFDPFADAFGEPVTIAPQDGGARATVTGLVYRGMAEEPMAGLDAQAIYLDLPASPAYQREDRVTLTPEGEHRITRIILGNNTAWRRYALAKC